MKKVTVIGSHGYQGSYGGWDQLVNMLVKYNDKNTLLRIISPRKNQNTVDIENIEVVNSNLSGSGLSGLMLDIFSSLRYSGSTDTFLLLGAKGIIGALIAKFIFRSRVVVNIGGIEWERPQYNKFIKLYLKLCFKLAERYSNTLILDNEYYLTFLNHKRRNVEIIPYGGEIYKSLSAKELEKEYDFLSKNYYLSVSRSIKDNKIYELCEVFLNYPEKQLVLISNLSNSAYGHNIKKRFGQVKNITLIDGLYDKQKLDCIRRNCFGYIHTHTLCGSAPSLIEMIVADKPIISIDRPQNRYTLDNQGIYFNDFKELRGALDSTLNPLSLTLKSRYNWQKIIKRYGATF